MSQEDTTQDDKKKLPELAKEKAARVRQHLKDNKTTYILCGATGVVCFVAGKHLRRPIVIDFQPVIDIVNTPVFHNHNIGNVVENTINNVGPCCKVVKRLEDGKIWEKSIDAARELAEDKKIPLEKAKWLISRNANGAIPDVFEMHYQNLATHTMS